MPPGHEYYIRIYNEMLSRMRDDLHTLEMSEQDLLFRLPALATLKKLATPQEKRFSTVIAAVFSGTALVIGISMAGGAFSAIYQIMRQALVNLFT